MLLQLRRTDSEEDKRFKILFGTLAIHFIETKAEEAFKDSNYKDGLLSEKDRVALVIKKLIGM